MPGAELYVERQGWFRPSFTLTDGINTFGELSYTGFWKNIALVEAANQSWTIVHPQKLFGRDIFINETASGQAIATIKTTAWRGIVTLEFTDGQVFRFTRQGIFSQVMRWDSEQFGPVLSITTKAFGFKKPFTVSLEQDVFKNKNHAVLMAFTGIYLILLRRAQAAVAH